MPTYTGTFRIPPQARPMLRALLLDRAAHPARRRRHSSAQTRRPVLARRITHRARAGADLAGLRRPGAYDYALSRVGRPAADVALVAVHAFDCHGAHAVGLTNGWAGRLEGHYATIFTPADVIGDDLNEVATRLIALPEQ